MLLPSRASTVPPATGNCPRPNRSDILGEYFEPGSGHRFVLATPGAQPELWAAYLDGARRSYRQHGVESAIEFSAVRDGHSTALFVAAIDEAGRITGGLRARGRLTRPDQAHAVREWAGRPGTVEMQTQIEQRLSAGVIEVKAVWVDPDVDARRAVTSALARAFIHSMDALHARFALCTAAGHAATRWQTSGGVIATDVPSVPYPDERYRTMLMWWDRVTIAGLVSAAQMAALERESALIRAGARGPSTESSVA